MAAIDESTVLEIQYISGLFTSERLRQVVNEGYTLEHDDSHAEGELADGAACYALSPELRRDFTPRDWPFLQAQWKPDTTGTIDGRIGELVKSGGLIIAEVQRLYRLKRKELYNGDTRRRSN